MTSNKNYYKTPKHRFNRYLLLKTLDTFLQQNVTPIHFATHSRTHPGQPASLQSKPSVFINRLDLRALVKLKTLSHSGNLFWHRLLATSFRLFSTIFSVCILLLMALIFFLFYQSVLWFTGFVWIWHLNEFSSLAYGLWVFFAPGFGYFLELLPLLSAPQLLLLEPLLSVISPFLAQLVSLDTVMLRMEYTEFWHQVLSVYALPYVFSLFILLWALIYSYFFYLAYIIQFNRFNPWPIFLRLFLGVDYLRAVDSVSELDQIKEHPATLHQFAPTSDPFPSSSSTLFFYNYSLKTGFGGYVGFLDHFPSQDSLLNYGAFLKRRLYVSNFYRYFLKFVRRRRNTKIAVRSIRHDPDFWSLLNFRTNYFNSSTHNMAKRYVFEPNFYTIPRFKLPFYKNVLFHVFLVLTDVVSRFGDYWVIYWREELDEFLFRYKIDDEFEIDGMEEVELDEDDDELEMSGTAGNLDTETEDHDAAYQDAVSTTTIGSLIDVYDRELGSVILANSVRSKLRARSFGMFRFGWASLFNQFSFWRPTESWHYNNDWTLFTRDNLSDREVEPEESMVPDSMSSPSLGKHTYDWLPGYKIPLRYKLGDIPELTPAEEGAEIDKEDEDYEEDYVEDYEPETVLTFEDGYLDEDDEEEVAPRYDDPIIMAEEDDEDDEDLDEKEDRQDAEFRHFLLHAHMVAPSGKQPLNVEDTLRDDIYLNMQAVKELRRDEKHFADFDLDEDDDPDETDYFTHLHRFLSMLGEPGINHGAGQEGDYMDLGVDEKTIFQSHAPIYGVPDPDDLRDIPTTFYEDVSDFYWLSSTDSTYKNFLEYPHQRFNIEQWTTEEGSFEDRLWRARIQYRLPRAGSTLAYFISDLLLLNFNWFYLDLLFGVLGGALLYLLLFPPLIGSILIDQEVFFAYAPPIFLFCLALCLCVSVLVFTRVYFPGKLSACFFSFLLKFIHRYSPGAPHHMMLLAFFCIKLLDYNALTITAFQLPPTVSLAFPYPVQSRVSFFSQYADSFNASPEHTFLIFSSSLKFTVLNNRSSLISRFFTLHTIGTPLSYCTPHTSSLWSAPANKLIEGSHSHSVTIDQTPYFINTHLYFDQKSYSFFHANLKKWGHSSIFSHLHASYNDCTFLFDDSGRVRTKTNLISPPPALALKHVVKRHEYRDTLFSASAKQHLQLPNLFYSVLDKKTYSIGSPSERPLGVGTLKNPLFSAANPSRPFAVHSTGVNGKDPQYNFFSITRFGPDLVSYASYFKTLFSSSYLSRVYTDRLKRQTLHMPHYHMSDFDLSRSYSSWDNRFTYKKKKNSDMYYET